MPSGLAAAIDPDRELVDGVAVETDLGNWTAYETPGHAPSHVCLYQPERRILISGDHVLGRISLYYDYGYTPDPVGEFLRSLDRADALDARLALSGHGKPFVDVHGHIEGNRALVHERLEATAGAAARGEPRTAVELVPRDLRAQAERRERQLADHPDDELPRPSPEGGTPACRARRRRRALATRSPEILPGSTLTHSCQGW